MKKPARPRITTAEELIHWIQTALPWRGCTCADCQESKRETIREVEREVIDFAARKTARKQAVR